MYTTQLKYEADYGGPTCFHMSSLNENKAKQICKKQPTDVIRYPFIKFIVTKETQAYIICVFVLRQFVMKLFSIAKWSRSVRFSLFVIVCL